MREAHRRESDRDKIDYIFGEYRHLMLNKAFSILKDRMQAEKALYESFIHIWKNIDKVDDPRSSQTIVFAVTIVRNCAYALMENEARHVAPAQDKKPFDARGIEEALFDMSASDIIKVVNKLGGENKNIFLLNYGYGLSNKKTAMTLKESETVVRDRLHKTQRRLRALLLRGGF
ncbi:MAG: sigma-70 family RNA polymerase sigma factor [Oscillospiraceae bacterium]|nr:sigma-70 family RNA polymerase sigma factor [Oscillospiraceae bacterium]